MSEPLTATTTRAGDEREAFEAWALSMKCSVERDKYGAYIASYTDDMWDGWQARAALSASHAVDGARDKCPHDDPQAWEQGLPPRTPLQREFEAAYGNDILSRDEFALSRAHGTGGYTFKRTAERFELFAKLSLSRAALATAPEQAGEAIYQTRGKLSPDYGWIDHRKKDFDVLRPDLFDKRIVYTAPPPASTNRLTDEQSIALKRLTLILESGRALNGISQDRADSYAEALRAIIAATEGE